MKEGSTLVVRERSNEHYVGLIDSNIIQYSGVRLFSLLSLRSVAPRLVPLRDRGEVLLDDVRAQQPKVLVLRRHDPNLELFRLQILSQHALQARDGSLNRLRLVERVSGVFTLHLLLQKVNRLLLLHARARGLVPDAVPRRVVLEQARPFLFVDADEHAHRRHRTHVRVLRVDLKLIRHSRREKVHGDLVAKLVAELRSLVPRFLNDVPYVRCARTTVERSRAQGW
eukprot:30400-Pelagococcus_subviridis.AAC.2